MGSNDTPRLACVSYPTSGLFCLYNIFKKRVKECVPLTLSRSPTHYIHVLPLPDVLAPPMPGHTHAHTRARTRTHARARARPPSPTPACAARRHTAWIYLQRGRVLPHLGREVLAVLLPDREPHERQGRLLLRPVRGGSGVRRVQIHAQRRVLHALRRGLHVGRQTGERGQTGVLGLPLRQRRHGPHHAR